ncbi:MAG: methionyl-tRNA formyltransferase [Candidatus Komeilibacteria bacterium RIFOXYC2_FULL_45_12]|nr:MAG: methionyl-tRNA formyltransferase [Candidatus Komeilibacteria bacterium RIFOXYC2_FULL_45_12]
MSNQVAKIIFFGTPEFAVPSLKLLSERGFNLVQVVTQPDKPAGRQLALRPPPVKAAAKQLGLKVSQSLNLERLQEAKADLGVAVAYGRLIPQRILDLFPLGCLNVHPSFLPKYRGPSPMQSAILNGDEFTGVSLIKLDQKMDHGPIVAQSQRLPIKDSDTAISLHDLLAQSGADLLCRILPDYLSGQIQPLAQAESLATFTKILKRADGQINWCQTALAIERQIRAYFPWPGSFTYFTGHKADGSKNRLGQKLKVKLLSVSLAAGEVSGKVGEFQKINGRLLVKCGQDSLLINELQPEGKRAMLAREFINGYFFS